MKNNSILFFFTFLLFLAVSNQSSAKEAKADPYITRSFLILKSTKDYSEAAQFVEIVSKKLDLEVKLRGLKPNKKVGLSPPKEECEKYEFTYPCYIARGRWDSGTYLSIEYSSSYKGFTEGLRGAAHC